MKNKFIRFLFKFLAFSCAFILIFAALQEIYCTSSDEVDKKIVSATKSFFALKENSIEALFIGPSQVFCTVNAQKLTEEYGISSYDFSGRDQLPQISEYYLKEALKRQKPKVVCIEVSPFFKTAFTDQIFAWNYLAMPLTKDKYISLNDVLKHKYWEVFKHCNAPLLLFHSMWNQTDPLKKSVELLRNEPEDLSRGFVARDNTAKVEIAYLGADDGEARPAPETSKKALLNMKNLCEKNGAELLFFKAPVSDWTRTDSKIVRNFMEENKLEFLEMNNYLDEIGIDGATDFFNAQHLNSSGADKCTDFIANYLMAHYCLND